MGVWIETFDSIFWLAISASLITGLGICFKYCYKIKCETISLCGCMQVKRDIRCESMLDLERAAAETQRDTIPSRQPSADSYIRPQHSI
jgi:hypothetical protein